MTQQTKMDGGPDYARATNLYPIRSWWQPRPLFKLDFGSTPFLEPGDICWVEGLQRRLAVTSWPGYLPSSVFPSFIPGSMPPRNPVLGQAKADSQTEPRKESYMWRVFLDVSQFAASDLTLRTKSGFLEVEGNHKERPDELGFITRCFTRKYRLPAGIDVTSITSTLSGDGILFVEAPFPENFLPTDTIIPVQVEKETETETEKESNDKMEETSETHLGSNDLQPTPLEAQDVTEFPVEHTTIDAPRHEEVSPLQGHENKGQSSTSQPEQDADLEHEELTLSEPTVETHASAPKDGDTKDFPETSVMDSQDTPDTLPINQREPPQLQDKGEIKSPSGSVEAEEIPHPDDLELGPNLTDEGLSHELEKMEQEHTK